MRKIKALKAKTQGAFDREIVHSASVSRGHYYGPRPGRPSASPELSVRDRIMILHKQLELLRRQAELGVFVSPDSLGRVERIARSLEAAA